MYSTFHFCQQKSILIVFCSRESSNSAQENAQLRNYLKAKYLIRDGSVCKNELLGFAIRRGIVNESVPILQIWIISRSWQKIEVESLMQATHKSFVFDS